MKGWFAKAPFRRRRLSSLGLVPLLAASVLASCQSVTTEYYDVSGTTVDQVFQGVGRHGPDRGKAIGQTQVEMGMNIWTVETDEQCRISRAEVELDLTVILPRWTDLEKSDSATRSSLKGLAKHVKDHEQTHVEIAKRFARKIEKDLNQISPQPTCKAVLKEAKRVFREGSGKHNRAQLQFDANTS